MALPTFDDLLAYYDVQPDDQKTEKGFTRGSDARAAYLDWYTSQAEGGFVSKRGQVRSSDSEIKAHAIYSLEKALGRRRRAIERPAASTAVTEAPAPATESHDHGHAAERVQAHAEHAHA